MVTCSKKTVPIFLSESKRLKLLIISAARTIPNIKDDKILFVIKDVKRTVIGGIRTIQEVCILIPY